MKLVRKSNIQQKIKSFRDGGAVQKFEEGNAIDDDLYEYLVALENPDYIGYDQNKKIWVSPTVKGYDTNQIGIGLDKRWNRQVKQFLAKNKRNYLTHSEMLGFMKDHIGYIGNVLKRHLNGRQISRDKWLMAMGVLYRGDGPSLWDKNSDIGRAFWGNSDSKFRDAITKFYEVKDKDRSRRHSDYYSNKKLMSLENEIPIDNQEIEIYNTPVLNDYQA